MRRRERGEFPTHPARHTASGLAGSWLLDRLCVCMARRIVGKHGHRSRRDTENMNSIIMTSGEAWAGLPYNTATYTVANIYLTYLTICRLAACEPACDPPYGSAMGRIKRINLYRLLSPHKTRSRAASGRGASTDDRADAGRAHLTNMLCVTAGRDPDRAQRSSVHGLGRPVSRRQHAAQRPRR